MIIIPSLKHKVYNWVKRNEQHFPKLNTKLILLTKSCLDFDEIKRNFEGMIKKKCF